MYQIRNFSDNDDVRILDTLGPFTVLEYQRDLSVMPQDAMQAYYCHQMNVRKRRVMCDLSKAAITLQAGAMQWDGRRCAGHHRHQGRGRSAEQGHAGQRHRRVGHQAGIHRQRHLGAGTHLQAHFAAGCGRLERFGGAGRRAVLACDSRLKHKAVMRSNFSSAAAGNEGLFNLGIVGSGALCLESPVPKEELVEIELQNDVVKIDGNMAIAWSGSLEFTVERSGKFPHRLGGFRRMSVNVYRGTGKVLVAPVAR